MFDPVMPSLGVEMRHISQVRFSPAKGWEDKDSVEAFRAHKMEVDTSDLEWADVVLFRRYYNTAMKCAKDKDSGFYDGEGCGFLTQDMAAAAAHPHGMKRQDDITRFMWEAVRDHWEGGIVYETDDNHWEIKPWNGYYPDVIAERDLIADMARRADLVTVATPALVAPYGRFNSKIRVIRNAIDPDLYLRDKPREEHDKQRLVYYGSTARMRDYAGRYATGNVADGDGPAYRAVEAYKDSLTRVFLGTNPGTEEIISRVFDEQVPYIEGIAEFSKALVHSDGDIGIAPLGGDEFDRSKSELHWLEYALADMAFIGQRFAGKNGPYNVVQEGVDGLLARGRGEWHDAMGRLAKNPNLTRDIAAAAKERVLRDYDYRVRAVEWADAFRYARDNARGSLHRAA
jgi:glycosyltransferase involved in cell wall biosynthesis